MIPASVENVVYCVKKAASNKQGSIFFGVSSVVMGNSTSKGITLYIRESSDAIGDIPTNPDIAIRFGSVSVGSVILVAVAVNMEGHLYSGWINYNAIDGSGKLIFESIRDDPNIIIAFIGESSTKELLVSMTFQKKMKSSLLEIYKSLQLSKPWQPFVFESVLAKLKEDIPDDFHLWGALNVS